MIEDYQDKNVEETLEAVADFNGERLQDFFEYEQEHKNRKTVIEPLRDDLVDVVPAGGTTYGGRYVAGVWFDDATESKTVRRTTRIEQAIEAGELQEVVE